LRVIIEIGHGFFQVSGQGIGLVAILGKQALIDVQHFATHFLHGAVDQIAGECPVPLIHELGQFWEALFGCCESFNLATDHSHVVGTDGGRLGVGAAIASGQAEAESETEAERSKATQGAQHGEEN